MALSKRVNGMSLIFPRHAEDSHGCSGESAQGLAGRGFTDCMHQPRAIWLEVVPDHRTSRLDHFQSISTVGRAMGVVMRGIDENEVDLVIIWREVEMSRRWREVLAPYGLLLNCETSRP